MTPLEQNIATLAECQWPGLADIIRQGKAKGLEKSELVARVTRGTPDTPLALCAILLMLDYIWKEES